MRRGVKGLTPNVWGLSRQGVHHVNARRNAAGDLTWPGSRLNDDVSVHMKIVQCRRLLLGTSLAVHHRQGSPSVARPVAPAEPHWLFVALTGDDGRISLARTAACVGYWSLCSRREGKDARLVPAVWDRWAVDAVRVDGRRSSRWSCYPAS